MEARLSIILRSVTFEDAKQIFDWRNDPWIVSLSASQRTVSWDEHVRWFTKVINNNQHLLFIIESENGDAMGSVRFDRTNNFQAAITIYILYPFVGRGFGTLALKNGSRLAFCQWSELRSIHAFIRNDNLRSLRTFSKAGFKPAQQHNSDVNQVEMVFSRQV